MRRYFVAFAGLVAAAGLASAQAPKFTPAGNLANAPVSANSAFTPAGNFANAQNASGEIIPVSGCSSCGPTVSNSNSSHYGAGAFRIGAGCAMPIGCSNWAAERTFLFGSCRQFFNPGNDCGSSSYRFGGCNGSGYPGSGGCNGGCGGVNYGGGGKEKHPCQGVTSYLNR
jgi:hypothetical protein